MKRYDLNLLYVLDALSRAESVKAAAEMLNLSAPAMSHALARLRETTGDPLLVRAGRKLIPTPRALSMIEVTRELVTKARAVLAPIVDDQKWLMAAREFLVMAPDELSIAHGVRLLDAIRSRMPNARLTLLPAAGIEFDRMRQGPIDVEVRPSGKLPPEIKMEVLRNQQMVVVMRRSHELAGQKMTLPRYVKAKHVCQATGNELDEMVERALAEAHASRTSVLRVATPYAALAAAAQSELIATVERSLVESVADSLGLLSVTFPLKIEGPRLLQVWHPRLDLDPQHIWLRRCIKSVFGKSNAHAVGYLDPEGADTRIQRRPAQ